VLGYVADPGVRERFGEAVRDLNAIWVSNETPGVFPAIRDRLAHRGPRGAFLLSVNGVPTAWTESHGAWIEWVAAEGKRE